MFVFEDIVYVYGSKINGVNVGNLGDGVVFLFFLIKVMIICEGGMIIFNNEEEDYIVRLFRN